MSKYCVIVDGYSAGNLLAPEFQKRGVPCLHVQSTPEIWPIFVPSYRPSDYVAHLRYEGNLEPLVQKLKSYDLACVLPGTETGVELADQLSERLGLPGNGTSRSAARRNKYMMVEACREAGLPVARQFKSERASDLVNWYRESGLRKVVLKPLNSAGTDQVLICETDEEVLRAAESILGHHNMLGLMNEDVLIQEFLDGTEYFLDTVSLNGQHHFTDIWRYQKRSVNGSNCVYDRNILCASRGADEGILQDYVHAVLDALHVRFGPAHTEVMLGPDGPRLVEVGTRLDGLSVPTVNQAAVGYSPVELTVDAYLDRDAYKKTTSVPYPTLKHALTVYLTSYTEGVVESVPGEGKIKALDSYFQMRLRASPGSRIRLTTNYFTAPGFVSLLHKDPEVLERDYQKIRAWEKEDGTLFVVRSQAS
ncbi:MAG: ATP-grasp domain-containing protein [Bdellovibrionales bacterium]